MFSYNFKYGMTSTMFFRILYSFSNLFCYNSLFLFSISNLKKDVSRSNTVLMVCVLTTICVFHFKLKKRCYNTLFVFSISHLKKDVSRSNTILMVYVLTTICVFHFKLKKGCFKINTILIVYVLTTNSLSMGFNIFC